jgi:DNA-binding NtrC family response regulator
MNNTLLLLTEDRSLTECLHEALRGQHLQLRASTDLAEMLRQADDGSLSAVLLDLDLKSGGGWRAADQILEHRPFLPLVLLTSERRQAELGEHMRAGLVLEKPVNAARLTQLLTTLWSQPEQERLLRTASQRNLLRYAHPFFSPEMAVSTPRHWGLNE